MYSSFDVLFIFDLQQYFDGIKLSMKNFDGKGCYEILKCSVFSIRSNALNWYEKVKKNNILIIS